MVKSAQSVTDKWARRLAGSTQDIQEGVNAVRINPAEQAIAKKAKLLANFTASVNDGSWERGLRNTTLESWKASMIQKGIQRIPQGAESAKPKFARFMTELLPYQEGVKAQIEAMPDISLEDSIARMTTWTREMAKFTRSS